MYQRYLRASLVAALRDSPVVFLAGARQTGKSTLVQSVIQDDHPARYLTLDDLAVLGAAQADPQGFVAGLDGPVALDEVQQAPELYRAIKLAVDRDRRPGRFLLTGSANVPLLPRLADALVGRVETLSLWPLSQGEVLGQKETFVDALFRSRLPAVPDLAGKDDLLERVVQGGYPEAVARRDPSRRESWFRGYAATILQRDVRDLAAIEKTAALPRLLALLAARASGLVNFAELSRTLGLPQTTLKRYLALLETAFLVFQVPPWFVNSGKRLTKTPKLFLTDTGLLAHLLGLGLDRLRNATGQLGPLLENFVGVELQKQLSWSTVRAKLHHFRTHTGQKVDFVLESAAGELVGIEVKSTAHVQPEDFKGLRAMGELAGERLVRGVVLYRGRDPVPFGPRLHALPVRALWELGRS